LAANLDRIPPGARVLAPFDIEAKIEHNHVVSHRDYLIRYYSTYGLAVESAYDALAMASYPSERSSIQRFLRSRYDVLKARLGQASSDHILAQLIDGLKTVAVEVPDVPLEDVEPCCDMIVAHAFVECTVLEAPKNAG
jgi:hypothetical protein